MDMTPEQTGFHIAEFAALKSDARDSGKTMAAHFRWAVAVSVLLFAWLATEGQDFDVPAMVFFLPAAITVLLGALCAVLAARVRLSVGYVREIERKLSAAQLGWESKCVTRKRLLATLQAASWVVLFAANLYVGIALQAELYDTQQNETRQTSRDV